MNYTTVSNLRYSNAAQTAIDMDVFFVELGEAVPFTAAADDPMQYGRDIYDAAVSGAFGPIAPYTGPSESERMAEEVYAERDQLLHELDLIVSNPLRWASFTEQEREAIAAYRQLLLDVPQQPGFPETVEWPTLPI
ncbi:tail fiber assembly protein [Pusillimonas sp.]|uniref:tail fiber assembly protein n=1 Tax=Pusillimonas sp. TaxID=3040095 RepID=UPI0037C68F36